MNSIQYIQLGTDLLDEITFETDNVPALWKYLQSQGVTTVSLAPEIEEDHFYKDILGFRPNPDSETKEAGNEFADLQVPDGTDAIQYLLDIPSSAKCPPNAVCHIVVGVTDVAQLKYEIGRRGLSLGEPEIGRDGKWQLNLYDPELMEFTPVQPPCCSPYTGPHPKP